MPRNYFSILLVGLQGLPFYVYSASAEVAHESRFCSSLPPLSLPPPPLLPLLSKNIFKDALCRILLLGATRFGYSPTLACEQTI